ncbi:MAG TPA: glycosyltransferase family 2 protein [Acetobacteraceae bacterium]|nr:glycosyltransferase family 2 protein [Acetobacteraceae bacterium]
MHHQANRLSAFVITHNRSAILGTCLRALAFADEVIVVDKSSTDDTRNIAACYADRVLTVPWSPTVEETRPYALSCCSHDWILFLDDDECLSPQAVSFIQEELMKPRADIYALPLRHYILGQHDERAYYWPEHHVRLFRRGAITFQPTVHAGIRLHSDQLMTVLPDGGVCIHHLSHTDTASWIERTNRYTSRPDRARASESGQDLVRFAHERIDHWAARSADTQPNGYPMAVALLRAIYDMVDCLKDWEQARGTKGEDLFRRLCATLDCEYERLTPLRQMRGQFPQVGLRAGAVMADDFSGGNAGELATDRK